MRVSVTPEQQAIEQGARGVYIVAVDNLSQGVLTPEVSLMGLPAGWFTMDQPDERTVFPNETRTVTVMVSPPVDAPIRSHEFAFFVSTQAADKLVPCSLQVTATRGAPYIPSAAPAYAPPPASPAPVPASPSQGRRAVPVLPPNVSIRPAGPIRFFPGSSFQQALVTIQNRSNLIERYDVEVLGIPRDWYGLTANQAVLEPRASTVIPLQLSPRVTLEYPAGEYQLQVRAFVHAYPDSFAEASALMTIDAPPVVPAPPPPVVVPPAPPAPVIPPPAPEPPPAPLPPVPAPPVVPQPPPAPAPEPPPPVPVVSPPPPVVVPSPPPVPIAPPPVVQATPRVQPEKAVAAARQPRPMMLRWLTLLSFVVVLASTALPWASRGSLDFAGWDSGFYLSDLVRDPNLGDSITSDDDQPVDAIVVSFAGGLGLLLSLKRLSAGKPTALVGVVPVLIGFGLAGLAAFEMIVLSTMNRSLDPGLGLFLLMGGGALAGFFGLLTLQREASL